MKKLILSLVAITTIALSSFGQAPEGFKYQAVVRDAGNTILNNQAVGIRMTIQQGSIGGTTVYQETFAPTTNAYGLVNLEIGSGTVVSGDFTTIDWANGPYFIETAVDVTGGTSYAVMGTSQLMSVPYALYAKYAENPGPQGPAGPQGPSGNDGATGAQGPQGPAGANGTNGTNGLDGNGIASTVDNGDGTFTFTYDDGTTFTTSDLTGPQGIQGIQGAVGATGATGPQGPAGTDGGAFLTNNIAGDVKQGFQAADHDGWVLLDGRAVSTLTASQQAAAAAIGFTNNIPNAYNRILKDQGALATTGGSNTSTLTQSNIPNYLLTGSAASAGNHSHTGVTSTDTHSHFYSDYGLGGSNLGNLGLFDSPATTRNNISYTTTDADSHNHTINTTVNGDHTHTVSVSSGGSGTEFNVENAYLSVHAFIYLGQ